MIDEEKTGKIGILIVALLVALPLLYIVSGQFMGHVNNKALTLNTPEGSSHLVDAMARMIERDVQSGFCPSAYFWPGHIRFDICGFQEGEQEVWKRLSMQLNDHLSREGAASDRDPDLNVVLTNVSRPNTWSLLFASNNTASLLKKAFVRLDTYNAKVKDKKAGYFPRIDNLASLVGDMTSLLGGESKRLTEAASSSSFYSMNGRYAYFHTLGTLAAACQTLQASRTDFTDVLNSQSAMAIFDQAMNKTCEKMGANPPFIFNARELSSLLTLSGSASAAVNDLQSLQTAIAAGARNH